MLYWRNASAKTFHRELNAGLTGDEAMSRLPRIKRVCAFVVKNDGTEGGADLP